MTSLVSNNEYQLLVEELQALKVEASFDLRLRAVEWAHKAGEIIRQHSRGDITRLLPKLAGDTGIGERTLWRYVEVYDKEPNFEKLISSHGKNISMSLILGTSKKDKRDECKHCPKHCI